MIYTILFFVAIVAVAGVIVWKILAKRRLEARRTWVVPDLLLNSVLLDVEMDMIAAGFGKADYVKDVKDCSEIAPEQLKRTAKALKPHRPKGETEWMKQYSFQRDPYPDGKDAGRHRVVAVKTSAGMLYIDTYRINGSLYRFLSPTEKTAGYFIGD